MMIRLETKNCNMILKEKQQKISALSYGNIDKYECLTGDEILSSNQRQIIEQVKFPHFRLGKALEKQTEKQFVALKSLDLSNKKYELQQIKGIFSQNVMNDLIRVKLKEIIKFQDSIKKDDLNYKSKRAKTYNFGKYSLPIVLI